MNPNGETPPGTTARALWQWSHDSLPLRPQVGGGQTLAVPAGIAVQLHRLYLPQVVR
jgi:hypothetical protein